jgi:hypothetical protein
MNAAYTEGVQNADIQSGPATSALSSSLLDALSPSSRVLVLYPDMIEPFAEGLISEAIQNFAVRPDFVLVEQKQSPASASASGEIQLIFEFKAVQKAQLSKIEKEYVIEDRSRLLTFLKNNITLSQLLLEAVPHLKTSFGQEVILQLRLSWEDDSSRTLYGVVPWLGTLTEARAALDLFDDAWWKENSHRAGGRIVFDYQLA